MVVTGGGYSFFLNQLQMFAFGYSVHQFVFGTLLRLYFTMIHAELVAFTDIHSDRYFIMSGNAS